MKHKLNDTPLIPDIVYHHLPEMLMESCSNFSDKRERDVFLTSALGILSGCFSDIGGKYNKDFVYSNLYVMIVAPPGSGKQVMKYARLFAEELHQKYRHNHNQEQDIIFKEGKEKKESIVFVQDKKPVIAEAPGRMVLLIPGNTSAAMIYQHLEINKGVGIICETETDTLSNSIKQDWGNYSDLLRKAFHHEPLSLSRKTFMEYIEINKPRLSVVLTGTPNQVGNLIGSSEDGLMSRFIFYIFNNEFEWRSQKPCDTCPDLSEFMRTQADHILRIAEKLKKSPVFYRLSDSQFDRMDVFFENKVAEMRSFNLQDAAGTIYRMGLIAFRTSMVLSVLRSAERLAEVRTINCEEEDFESTLHLADTYFYHALETYRLLPKNEIIIHNPGMVKFYGFLPEGKFTSSEAEEIGRLHEIKDRTVRKYLQTLDSKKYLVRTSHGHYEKPKIEEAEE